MTPIEELSDLIRRCTVVYRKGAAVKERDVGGVHVVEVFGYPETPSHGVLVDVHFANVGFTEAVAGVTGEDLIAAVEKAPDGYYVRLTLDDLRGGPSYRTTGAWLGDQELALRFIALGAHLGLWDAVTPGRLGITGPAADMLAGQGFVMNSGIRTPRPGEGPA